MSSSEERVGGVEPETVTALDEAEREVITVTFGGVPVRDFIAKAAYDAVVSALRLVEEELRQAREVAHSRLRDRARLVRRAERAEADLDLLTRRFALVASRSGVRAQALQLAEECITENVANGEGVDSQPAVLDAIFDALKYEIADEPDGARPGAEPPIQSTPVSPVQGEHHAQPEGESQMDDNNLNHLIGERDAMKWVDGFLTVVPDADRDLMHTWFACAIESGRMTVQGEHEQDGEPVWKNVPPLEDFMTRIGMPLDKKAQDGDTEAHPPLDEVYAERNKVVLAFAALVKEQGWDVGLTVDPSSPDWPVLMIETDAGQVSWHFQAGELPPGLPLFAGKWDGHSTPEKYARLAELVRSAFGLSREIAQDGDTEETT